MKDTAIVLAINGRFYCGKSKTGRAQTAWSLAGAKLFLNNKHEYQNEKIQQAETFLKKKGYHSNRLTVSFKQDRKND